MEEIEHIAPPGANAGQSIPPQSLTGKEALSLVSGRWPQLLGGSYPRGKVEGPAEVHARMGHQVAGDPEVIQGLAHIGCASPASGCRRSPSDVAGPKRTLLGDSLEYPPQEGTIGVPVMTLPGALEATPHVQPPVRQLAT